MFSVGERGTNIKPELIHEVVTGLIAAVNSICPVEAIDSIVYIHVTGAMWALLVAMELFTTEADGSDKQTTFIQNRPYLHRTIYTPDLSVVGKCIIIDDILSGGGTISQMK